MATRVEHGQLISSNQFKSYILTNLMKSTTSNLLAQNGFWHSHWQTNLNCIMVVTRSPNIQQWTGGPHTCNTFTCKLKYQKFKILFSPRFWKFLVQYQASLVSHPWESVHLGTNCHGKIWPQHLENQRLFDPKTGKVQMIKNQVLFQVPYVKFQWCKSWTKNYCEFKRDLFFGMVSFRDHLTLVGIPWPPTIQGWKGHGLDRKISLTKKAFFPW